MAALARTDLAFNADGTLWVRYKGKGHHFDPASGHWSIHEIKQVIKDRLLHEQNKALDEAVVSVNAKISGDRVDEQGNCLGRRPLARIKVQHNAVTLGASDPALTIGFYESDPNHAGTVIGLERVAGLRAGTAFGLGPAGETGDDREWYRLR